MTLLHALPVIARRNGLVVRLAADRGWVKQNLRALQRHAACGFREPLIPANAHADFCVAGVPHFETGVAGVEVILLVVARAVRNMAFTINPEVAAVGVDDRDAVETRAAGQLIEADRQHHLQLFGDFLEMFDRDVFFHRRRQLQIVRVRLLAEVRRLEQLLNQDDLRAFSGGFTHQPFSDFEVGFQIPGTGHLSGGNGNDTAHESSPGKCFDGRQFDRKENARTGHEITKPEQWRLYSR
ncbi:hypothetical protein D3C85_339160 [compost metagenome]